MDLVLFSGYARLPANTPAQKMYEELVLVAVVDMNTGVVHEADCTVATDLAKKFVCSLLVGYDMNRGIDPLMALAERRYQGHLRKALVSCIKMIGAQYAEVRGK
ncbi:MAG: DUF3870 domain-containing protein [Oscillospiraceae bacterium]